MKEFKGTKGDWEIKNTYCRFMTDIVCGSTRIAEAKHFNDGLSCYSFKNDPRHEEGRANAKLISAAPDLLFALQNLLMVAKNYEVGNHSINIHEAYEIAEKAINKAI